MIERLDAVRTEEQTPSEITPFFKSIGNKLHKCQAGQVANHSINQFDSPLLIRGDLLHELLDLWLGTVVAEVPLEILDGLVVRQDVASAAADLLHVVAGAHDDF